jgi:hypothetical protein
LDRAISLKIVDQRDGCFMQDIQSLANLIGHFSLAFCVWRLPLLAEDVNQALAGSFQQFRAHRCCSSCLQSTGKGGYA